MKFSIDIVRGTDKDICRCLSSRKEVPFHTIKVIINKIYFKFSEANLK